MEKEIKGISCEAKNCVFNDNNNSCTAGHINVGNKSATQVSDTKCETFKCDDKNECE